MWGIDMEGLIQILFLVLIFGVGIVQFLYRTFVKPLAEEAQRRQAAGGDKEPGKALRDFLAELRGEPPQPQVDRPREPPPEPRPERPAREQPARRAPEPAAEELIWEDGDERGPARTPVPPRRPPGERRRSKRGDARDARPLRKDRAVRAARASVQEVLQEIADDERYELGEGPIRGHLEEHLARKFSSLLESAVPDAALVVAPSRRIPRLGGVGLREALLAQVILGPPRARQPRRGALGWRQSV